MTIASTFGDGDPHAEIIASVGPPTTNSQPTEPEGKRDARLHLESGREAAHIIRSLTLDGISTLRYWTKSKTWIHWRDGVWNVIDAEHAGDLVHHFMGKRWTYLRRRAVEDVVAAIRSTPGIRVEGSASTPLWLTPHPWDPARCICTKSRIYNVSSPWTGLPESIPATPRLFSLAALPFEIDATAPAPVAFERFLHEVLAGDRESIDTIWKWFGLCLTPDTSYQKALSMVGPGGCGKGTTIAALSMLLGDSLTTATSFEKLNSRFGLDQLEGKLLATMPDVKLPDVKGLTSAAENLLSIPGEDRLPVEGKCGKTHGTKLFCRLMMASNEPVYFADVATAWATRIIGVRFVGAFRREGVQDVNLRTKFIPELPGIMRLAVEGLRRLRLEGFKQPESGREIITSIEQRSSPVVRFVEAVCRLDPNAVTPAEAVETAWEFWWKKEYGNDRTSRSKFRDSLLTKYPDAVRRTRPSVPDGQHRPWFYEGLSLVSKSETKP